MIHVRFGTELATIEPLLPNDRSPLTLLLVCDGNLYSDAQLETALQPLIGERLVYFCAWGEDCERIHDAVDRLLCRNPCYDPGKEVCLTTWHPGESLRKALWYFKVLALPTDEKLAAECTRLVIVVGGKKWLSQVQNYFGKESSSA